ncbi:hypothetical protein ALI144C_19530 [Actinosynnema sp. ALI-1.44]|uniref:hypothetical protein n=1 Tax=Actinosynnema sp. ALI-1.44 TaxID=1933779 RepID=UPI00097BBAB4|nr:hypothetical protein [Actinosynnema sp. ALI-1.44]ONI81511.1 hypothetical protein ALI144C_19530 [Actinosynnema sp. ALI-1.44]
MRKFLSAGVLAAATTLALLPFTAQASPDDDGHDSNSGWTHVKEYDDLVDCLGAGMTGQFEGDWENYTCHLNVSTVQWHLLVSDHEGDDNGDNNGDNGGDNGGDEDNGDNG